MMPVGPITTSTQEDIEKFIRKYNLGPGLLIKFENDPAEYIVKNVSADRKTIFVSLKNRAQTYNKQISNIVKINRKPVSWVMKENTSFTKNQEVEVINGPFKGTKGKISQINPDGTFDIWSEEQKSMTWDINPADAKLIKSSHVTTDMYKYNPIAAEAKQMKETKHKRISKLIESALKEADALPQEKVPGNRPPTTTPPANAPTPEEEKALKAGLDAALAQLPTALQHVSPEEIQQESMEESLALLAGLGLSAPAVVKMIGKGLAAMGKKVDAKVIQSVGEKVAKFGEKWHHAYEGSIKKFVLKMYPTLAPDKADKAAKAILISLIATLGAVSAYGVAHSAIAGHAGAAVGEAGLTTIKASEVANLAQSIVPEILAAA